MQGNHRRINHLAGYPSHAKAEAERSPAVPFAVQHTGSFDCGGCSSAAWIETTDVFPCSHRLDSLRFLY